MIANYHTHTARCNHASGTEEEYVRAGIAAGLKILGFSDHTPYPFAGGYYSHIRMQPHELAEYAGNILALREKYADQIQIPLGVEIEYFPQFWQEQLSMLRDAGIEYLLLGQHWSAYAQDRHYCAKATDREDLLAEYCHSVCEAMQTGTITYIAHPDILNFTGDAAVYRHHMSHLCREANGCGIPMEINFQGIRSGKNYPERRFWELAAEEGCRVILGNDAHAPEGLVDTVLQEKALVLVEELGLELLDTVSLQRF